MRSRRPNREASTTASKRKRRRLPRRDVKRGGDYYPTEVNVNSAKRGASGRLWLATGCAALTVVSLVAAMVSTQGAFALAALVMLAFLSFNATLALIFSARREEAVHGLLAADPVPFGQLMDGSEGISGLDGVDGSVEKFDLAELRGRGSRSDGRTPGS